ncbi:MAG TPA: DUF2891 domain-containing protein [Amycolatopsis sp.]|jgi:hypothetical protein|nr:DUF2891 domain-containing protein [Amycolatopsis sp.]
MTDLSEHAPRYAAVALRNLATEFPYAPQHLVRDGEDRATPRELHPAFHTSFDWHSCVHMHWLLVRVLTRWPDELDTGLVRSTLDKNLTEPALATEADYLRGDPSFERPYGWAWAMVLAAALATSTDPGAARWSAAMVPLREAVEELTLAWLRKSPLPDRYGVHSNGAFALSLLIDAASALGREELLATCRAAARIWFAGEKDYPASWEPNAHDFLSPALTEADLMRRVLPEPDFPGWLDAFLPGLASGTAANLLEPAEVRDAADGHQGHLYGLNLSRSWQLARLADALPAADPRVPLLRASAIRQRDAALPRVVSGSFVHDHWLATYAFLALGGTLV